MGSALPSIFGRLSIICIFHTKPPSVLFITVDVKLLPFTVTVSRYKLHAFSGSCADTEAEKAQSTISVVTVWNSLIKQLSLPVEALVYQISVTV